jgi:quercetin dioxygenase-like cupin family protein
VTDETAGFAIVGADQVPDSYEGTDVPGEFRSLTEALGSTQVAATLIRIPPHSDFEQGTGHRHREIEELYLVARGTLTMRFEGEVREVSEGSIVRVAPGITRSHRNEAAETVELWAFSVIVGDDHGIKVDEFWPASSAARQARG